jgi:ADP-heptose:LPS heptosyltransferase
MSKIELLKTFDKITGKILVSLLSFLTKKKRRSPEIVKNILFIRPGGIGDAVLLLPSIKILRKHYRDARIDILCEKRNAEIFRLCQGINALYLYDKGLGLLQCLQVSYDIVIDTEQWHRLSAVVAYLTKAPVRIGFDTNERGKMFTHKIPYSHDNY